MERYAAKIGATFRVIRERKWPDLPPVMEKFQVWEMAQSSVGVNWHIFLDADALIHPDMFDVTALLGMDTTFSGITSDMTLQRFKPDQYFLRDGRFIGKGNWCAGFSEWCLDYYRPPMPFTKATIDRLCCNIQLTVAEQQSGVMYPSHLIDDYIVSRNIARYGLKHTLISEVGARFGLNAAPYLWHKYLQDSDRKILEMRDVLKQWGLEVSK
jgi:hypothetical protein